MRIKFKELDATWATIQCDNAEIYIDINDDAVESIRLGERDAGWDGFEDDLFGIGVLIDGEWFTLAAVIVAINRQLPAALAELEAEIEDEKAHEREIRSLEMTGRI